MYVGVNKLDVKRDLFLFFNISIFPISVIFHMFIKILFFSRFKKYIVKNLSFGKCSIFCSHFFLQILLKIVKRTKHSLFFSGRGYLWLLHVLLMLFKNPLLAETPSEIILTSLRSYLKIVYRKNVLMVLNDSKLLSIILQFQIDGLSL